MHNPEQENPDISNPAPNNNTSQRKTKPRRSHITLILLSPVIVIALLIAVDRILALTVPLYQYAHPEIPIIAGSLSFPLSWFYLFIARTKSPEVRKNTLKALLSIAPLILIFFWTFSSAQQITQLAPLMKIDQSFTVPSDWEEQEGNSRSINAGEPLTGCLGFLDSKQCPQVDRGWIAPDTPPLTPEQLRTLAEDNNITTLNKEHCWEEENHCSISGNHENTYMKIESLQIGNETHIRYDITEKE